MKNYFCKIIVLIISLNLFGCGAEVVNLSIAKNRVQNYYESGEFEDEVEHIINKVIDKINNVDLPDNPAVIFDVDDTALSGYEYTKNLGFGYTWKSWNKWVLNAKAKPIVPVKIFYNYLISLNIKIIFLTGRTIDQYEATKQNLINAGYTKFDTLVCMSKVNSEIPTYKFKESERSKLISKGYKIIACIGDQLSDLKGKFTGIKVKIPNYLYILNN